MGDAAIQAAANAIRGSIRRVDIPVRYAGDEFLVILPDTQLADAQQVAGRILNSPVLNSLGEGEPVTLSIGVCQSRAGDEPKQLVQRADEAAYASKRAGKNRVTTV